ncbi:MAG: hypothetical protein R3297_03945, partial [Desulfobulbales bacterium]|nr:hypothetical protein [Desulfobulbales bacterium]
TAGSILISMALFVRLYAAKVGLLPKQKWLENISEKFSLEVGLVAGAALSFAGILFYFYALRLWADSNFGALDYQVVLRIALSGTTFIILGIQIFFSSFIISLLGINIDDRHERAAYQGVKTSRDL